MLATEIGNATKASQEVQRLVKPDPLLVQFTRPDADHIEMEFDRKNSSLVSILKLASIDCTP